MFKTFFLLMKTEQTARKYFFKLFTISMLACLIGIYFGIEHMQSNGDWEKLLAKVDPMMVDHFIKSATISYIGVAVAFSLFSAIYFTVKHSKE